MTPHEEIKEFIWTMPDGTEKELLAEVHAWASLRIFAFQERNRTVTREHAVALVYQHPMAAALLVRIHALRGDR